jgi:hypothetical protein
MAENNEPVAPAQNGLVPAFTVTDAMNQLTEYLKHRSTIIKRKISVAQFKYGPEPFWAITVSVFGWEPKSLHGRCGFQVYRGRVELITRGGSK